MNTVALRYVSSPKSITIVTILVVICVVRLLVIWLVSSNNVNDAHIHLPTSIAPVKGILQYLIAPNASFIIVEKELLSKIIPNPNGPKNSFWLL